MGIPSAPFSLSNNGLGNLYVSVLKRISVDARFSPACGEAWKSMDSPPKGRRNHTKSFDETFNGRARESVPSNQTEFSETLEIVRIRTLPVALLVMPAFSG